VILAFLLAPLASGLSLAFYADAWPAFISMMKHALIMVYPFVLILGLPGYLLARRRG